MRKIKTLIQRILYYLELLGFSPVKLVYSLRGLPFFLKDRLSLGRQMRSSGREFPFGRPYPCLEDRFTASGSARWHYFHQDLLVARRVFSRKPELHVDIGSRVDGLVAHIASFRKIEVFDVRPLTDKIPNVEFRQADLMGALPGAFRGYCDSLSCLHALEHFGLGRYGDPVDYDGWRKGLENIYSILKPVGTFYFSVPIGPQRIECNAHRVFAVEFLLKYFAAKYEVRAFSYVDDAGDLHEDVKLDAASVEAGYGCRFGCCIFELVKL